MADMVQNAMNTQKEKKESKKTKKENVRDLKNGAFDASIVIWSFVSSRLTRPRS